MDQKKDCSCGKSYWPSQAWQHLSCIPVQGQAVAVSDQKESKKPFDRVAYQREYMRAYRARGKITK